MSLKNSFYATATIGALLFYTLVPIKTRILDQENYYIKDIAHIENMAIFHYQTLDESVMKEGITFLPYEEDSELRYLSKSNELVIKLEQKRTLADIVSENIFKRKHNTFLPETDFEIWLTNSI